MATICSCPFAAADISAVDPSLSRTLGSALAAINMATICSCPFAAADISAVFPSMDIKLGSALAASNMATICLCPIRTAENSADPGLALAARSRATICSCPRTTAWSNAVSLDTIRLGSAPHVNAAFSTSRLFHLAATCSTVFQRTSRFGSAPADSSSLTYGHQSRGGVLLSSMLKDSKALFRELVATL